MKSGLEFQVACARESRAAPEEIGRCTSWRSAHKKGGSGKTTLSGHLAVQAELVGTGPVALIDTDPQGSLAAWWNERPSDAPAFVSTSLAQLPADIERLRLEGCRLVVIIRRRRSTWRSSA